jgi:type I restriction enzyme M protein
LAAHDYIVRHNATLDKAQKKHLKLKALRGVDIVDSVVRLRAMNLLLHGIGPGGTESEPPVSTDDALRADPGDRFDLVLTKAVAQTRYSAQGLVGS